jgi:O-antigen ligase
LFTSLRWAKQYVALMIVASVAVVVGLIVTQGSLLYVVALAAIPVVLLWPVEASLGAFVFLIPFDPIALLGNGRTLTWFVGAATVAVLLAAGLTSGRLHRPPRSALWWVLFTSWGAITSFWALDSTLGTQRLPTVAALIGLYLIVTSFEITAKELRTVFILGIVGGVLASLYSSVTFYQGANYAGTMRASLIVGEREAPPNYFAACLLLPISMTLAGIIYSQQRFRKILYAAALAVMLLALFLITSRGAVLAFGVLTFIYFLRIRRVRRILLPVAISLVLLVFVPNPLSLRFQEAVSTGGAGRVSIWIAGLDTLEHYWLIGAGMENFPVAYSQFAGSAPVFKGSQTGSHNLYLKVSVEEGILGLLLLFAALASQFSEAHKIQKDSGSEVPELTVVPYEAACWAMLTVGVFMDSIWDKEFWICWILLAVVVRIRSHARVEPAPVDDYALAAHRYR